MNNDVLNQTQGFNVSPKYQVIKTSDVLERLMNAGYEVTATAVTRPRSQSKHGFQKHMVRLSHRDLAFNVGDSRPEVVLINSYDGSTSLKMLIGVFRLVCSNGLIVGNTFGGVTIRHVGDIGTKIDEGLDYIKTKVPLIAATINQFKSTQLTADQIADFTLTSAKLVTPDNTVSIKTSFVNRVLREEDAGNDLWRVFNRVQERLIRGGISYVYKVLDEEGKTVDFRNNTTRAIRAIDRQVLINTKLWDLAESFKAA